MIKHLFLCFNTVVSFFLVTGCAAAPQQASGIPVDNLYSSEEVAKADSVSSDLLIIKSDSNDNGVADGVDSWISSLDEDILVKNALRSFARSIQEAVLFKPYSSSSSVIVNNLIDSGTDVLALKGHDEGRKLLDTVADKVCDTRLKAVKYSRFLSMFARDVPPASESGTIGSPSMI